MALFTGLSQTATLSANNLTNLQSVEYSDSIDPFLVEVAGATVKTTITGLKEYKVTVNGLLTGSDVTLLGNIAIGTTGAWVNYPDGNTTGNIHITSTNATVISRDHGAKVDGLTPYSISLNLDDITIAAAA